jgi:hypothetical protein
MTYPIVLSSLRLYGTVLLHFWFLIKYGDNFTSPDGKIMLCDVSDHIQLFDLNEFQFVEFLRIHYPLLFTGLGFKIPCKKQKSVNNFSLFSLHKHCDWSYLFLSFNCMTWRLNWVVKQFLCTYALKGLSDVCLFLGWSREFSKPL